LPRSSAFAPCTHGQAFGLGAAQFRFECLLKIGHGVQPKGVKGCPAFWKFLAGHTDGCGRGQAHGRDGSDLDCRFQRTQEMDGGLPMHHHNVPWLLDPPSALAFPFLP
jgi:hypothetical protein